MYYTIYNDELYTPISREVSRAADEAYSDSGQSLYDSVVLTSRDYSTVDKCIDDAVSALVSRAFDICKYSPETKEVEAEGDEEGETETVLTGRMRLHFYVPDMDPSMEDAAKAEISRYIALFVCSKVFATRRPALAQPYLDDAQAALNKAITILKSRKAPQETWS